MFFSELMVIAGGITGHLTVISVLVLIALLASFCGMLQQLTRILLGRVRTVREHNVRPWDGVPAMSLLLGALLVLSVWLPKPLLDLLHQAAEIVGGKA